MRKITLNSQKKSSQEDFEELHTGVLHNADEDQQIGLSFQKVQLDHPSLLQTHV